MKCAYCGGRTRVKECRSGEDEVIRKRECLNCGKVFFTSETDVDFDFGLELLRKYRTNLNNLNNLEQA